MIKIDFVYEMCEFHSCCCCFLEIKLIEAVNDGCYDKGMLLNQFCLIWMSLHCSPDADW